MAIGQFGLELDMIELARELNWIEPFRVISGITHRSMPQAVGLLWILHKF